MKDDVKKSFFSSNKCSSGVYFVSTCRNWRSLGKEDILHMIMIFNKENNTAFTALKAFFLMSKAHKTHLLLKRWYQWTSLFCWEFFSYLEWSRNRRAFCHPTNPSASFESFDLRQTTLGTSLKKNCPYLPSTLFRWRWNSHRWSCWYLHHLWSSAVLLDSWHIRVCVWSI